MGGGHRQRRSTVTGIANGHGFCTQFFVDGRTYIVETRNVSALCPDLLRFEQLGEADTVRGKVVRAFFALMRWWPIP